MAVDENGLGYKKYDLTTSYRHPYDFDVPDAFDLDERADYFEVFSSGSHGELDDHKISIGGWSDFMDDFAAEMKNIQTNKL